MIAKYEVVKFLSNTLPMVGTAVVCPWVSGPTWHYAVLVGVIVIANVLGHWEGLERGEQIYGRWP